MLFEDKATLHAKYTAACVLPSHSMPAVFWMWMWFPLTSVRESCFSSNITRSGRYICMKINKQHRTFLMFAYLPLVKTLCFQAIERGIYFEICYSPAIRGECNVHTLEQWHGSCMHLCENWWSTSYICYCKEMVKATQRVYICLVWNLIVFEEWHNWLQHYTGCMSYHCRCFG